MFGRDIYGGVITLNDALEEQMNMTIEIDNFNEETKPKNWNQPKKYCLMKMHIDFLKGNKEFLMVLKTKYFQ